MLSGAHIDIGGRIEFPASECESGLKGETTLDCRVRYLNCGTLATFKDSMSEVSCMTDLSQANGVHTSDDS
jgi:hypothetical protein